MSKTFSAEVRAQACARVLAGERPTAVARDVGVTLRTLHRWRVTSGQVTSTDTRAPSGQLLPGHTANPGGSTTHVERAQRLLEEAAPEKVQQLLSLINDIATEQDPERVEVKVAKGHVLNKLIGQVLDRGLGKPQARVKIEADTPLDADRLAALRTKLAPASPPANTPTQGD